MMVVHPDILAELVTEPYRQVQTVVVENIPFFRRIVSDIIDQINGFPGNLVLSKENVPIEMSKNAEIITDLLSFNLNTKNLLAKVTTALEREAHAAENIYRQNEILTKLESFIDDISFGFRCDLKLKRLGIGQLIKSVGIEICDKYDNLLERIIDYIELIREFDRNKLFFIVNLRSFFTDDETSSFIDTVCRQGYDVIMLESFSHAKLENEKRLTIDTDLCEF